MPSLALCLSAAMLLYSCAESRGGAAQSEKRLIVLGIDGMDPGFLERHWRELPTLDRLRHEGDFRRLATTNPPQSPVAWSTFITGLNPGGHGIYDFVHRDPDTMQPVSSMSSASQGGQQLELGPYILPLTAGRVVSNRRGVPFWKMLSDSGVPVTVLRMPTDFPPVECEAHALSGMGTPDLRGSFGTFAYFTDDPKWQDRKITGGEIHTVRIENHRAVLRVPGPVNSLRRDHEPTFAEIEAFVDPGQDVARFDVAGHSLVLKRGEWSDWIPVQFSLLGPLAGIDGMFRIYVKQLHPRLGVYVSPVSIDPASPAMPISQPESYSRRLTDRIGRYYTLGMPYDTAALRHGVFTREEYREHSRQVSEQTIRLLEDAVDRFQSGVLFFHFFGVDQDSHMLWGEYEQELLETYRRVDRMLAWVQKRASDAALLVLSDHGFTSFNRAVHLNSWLRDEGLLAVDDAGGIDWSRTKAYAMGLNAIYVNQQFRERNGMVAAGEESEQVVERIRRKLAGYRDPKTQRAVVDRVYATGDAESGPDLLVGYADGFRASWQTALGEVPGPVVEDNSDEWRGDHCIDPRHVPGVLLSNRKLQLPDPRLDDVTATILEVFGVGKSDAMEGRNLYVPANDQAE
jgi:predicted AlkP superfamily phosphohydrolase/phosphomutase